MGYATRWGQLAAESNPAKVYQMTGVQPQHSTQVSFGSPNFSSIRNL